MKPLNLIKLFLGAKMDNSVIRKIDKDQYGNVIKSCYQDKYCNEERTYEYNEYNDLTKYIFKYNDRNNNQESEIIYAYEYDNHGYKVKMTQTNLFLDENSNNRQSSFYYINEYDDNQKIKKIIFLNEDKSTNLVLKYYYKGVLLEKKEEYKDSFDRAYKTYYYQYTEDGELYEKKCCLENGELSYYKRYKLLSNGRYSKQLLSPVRGEYTWLLDEASMGMCSFYIKEPSLSPDIIKEICNYAISNYPSYKFIRVDVCESEDITFINELEEIEHYYRKNFDLNIIHDF